MASDDEEMVIGTDRGTGGVRVGGREGGGTKRDGAKKRAGRRRDERGWCPDAGTVVMRFESGAVGGGDD